MGTVIDDHNLSTEIVVNQFRDPLRNASGGQSSDEITDPQASNRGNANPFIVTSFPDTDPLYPMVIVREGSDAGGRPDRRADLHEHDYLVVAEIITISSTTYFDIRDSIRGWFEDRIDTFESNGFEEPEIDSANRIAFESETKTVAGEIVFSGTVNTG